MVVGDGGGGGGRSCKQEKPGEIAGAVSEQSACTSNAHISVMLSICSTPVLKIYSLILY